ncbi:MAG: type III-B CRISPR module RAMP protein Cmr4 [Magnetococcus sp. DMHC-6]
MLTRPYLLHALSPLHAGTGQAADVIDLPIARMRSTGIPMVPGSSIKGVLRDARDMAQVEREKLYAVFGPATDDLNKENSAHAGALLVGDARLLALPVRSFKGVFAWITSPLLLSLARRDLAECIKDLPNLPTPEENGAVVGEIRTSCNVTTDGKIYLEDLDLCVLSDPVVNEWAKVLAPYMESNDGAWFTRRLVVVGDEVMSFLWETATQIDTRIRMDANTRTVVDGALWVEESLPPESLLLGLLAADRSRRQKTELNPADVMNIALPKEEILQFGGKATVGRGRCRLVPFAVNQE